MTGVIRWTHGDVTASRSLSDRAGAPVVAGLGIISGDVAGGPRFAVVAARVLEDGQRVIFADDRYHDHEDARQALAAFDSDPCPGCDVDRLAGPPTLGCDQCRPRPVVSHCLICGERSEFPGPPSSCGCY